MPDGEHGTQNDDGVGFGVTEVKGTVCSSRVEDGLELRTGQTGNSGRGITEVGAGPPAAAVDDDNGGFEQRLSCSESGKEVKDKVRQTWLLGEIAEVSLWLVFFSIWGVLARLGISALETYPGKTVDGLVWTQFIGCVVMGFLAESKSMFNLTSGQTLQVYIGMTTGFCGSMTTFSSWMQSTFLAMANAGHEFDRPRGFSVLALFNGIIVTLCMSLAGLKFGGHVGVFVRYLWPKVSNGRVCRPSGKWTVPVLQSFAVVFGLGCWVGAILMSIFVKKWRGKVLFGLVFGPVGTISRWLLSRYLNTRVPGFLMGTFAANILGTMLIGVFSIAQQRTNGVTGCNVLQGLMDGYCGCLTTVSTFALELQSLKRHHAWRYGGTSISVGVIMMCLTMGVNNWRFEEFRLRQC
ncbi:CrcB-like protein-domain-containing protein [Lipomyces arxii]|uniref:CrcB-like protein-domain-containing protein n=1 Tax=Lipomyces arxii TaxID=56418 RepID=UPI0034CF02B9